MQNFLLILSAIFAILGPISYAISIAKGISKPHRMTRFILFFVLGLNFASILAAEGNIGAKIFAGITFVQATIIFLMSIGLGMGGTTLFDLFCLGVAIVGVIGWKVTGNPITGMWFSILADLFAYLPAFFKTWKHPHTEASTYYITGAIGAFLGLIAYKIEATSFFQIYIILCCLVMIGLIYRKKIFALIR